MSNLALRPENSMAGEDIRVHVRIHMLPASEGGRNAPVPGGASYRPNHNFFGPANRDMAVGPIELCLDQALHPGDTFDLDMTFLHWPWRPSELCPGREWLIQEGGSVVGIGTILSILN
jgi:hypothetical protein